MKATVLIAAAAAALVMGAPASAQMRALSDPVVAHPDPESLLSSTDPVLQKNKQASLHIMRELLQCNQWSRAGEWLTDKYIQHNPLVASGLDPVLKFFGGRAPSPIPDRTHWKTKIVSVTAEGDLVTVANVVEAPDPRAAGKTYTTTWFDMWRIKDGKADEHWDNATIAPPATAR